MTYRIDQHLADALSTDLAKGDTESALARIRDATWLPGEGDPPALIGEPYVRQEDGDKIKAALADLGEHADGIIDEYVKGIPAEYHAKRHEYAKKLERLEADGHQPPEHKGRWWRFGR